MVIHVNVFMISVNGMTLDGDPRPKRATTGKIQDTADVEQIHKLEDALNLPVKIPLFWVPLNVFHARMFDEKVKKGSKSSQTYLYHGQPCLSCSAKMVGRYTAQSEKRTPKCRYNLERSRKLHKRIYVDNLQLASS